MATYAELHELRSDSTLRNRVTVAVVVKAQELMDSAAPTTGEIIWANDALQNPVQKAKEVLNYVIAANKSATVDQIQGATDVAVQTNVNTAADVLIAGGV